MMRVARPGDIPAIAAIEQSCFGTGAWSEGLVRDEVRGDRHHVLVDDDLQAYGAISLGGDVADLDRIAVLPSARRSGLARDLLAALVGAARQRDVERMLLEVAADNEAALGLYASFGFATINRRPRYYPRGADALVMQLDIEEHA